MDLADLVPPEYSMTGWFAAARRSPVVHFFAIGLGLALLRARVPAPGAHPTTLIVVTPEVIDRLAANLPSRTGRLDRAAFESWLDDEVLYREGVARGLGWNPASIARMVQVARFVEAKDDPYAATDDAAMLVDSHRLGLDRDDPVVRAQVVGKMRLLLQQPAMRADPGDDELQTYLDAHPERFTEPARATFAHVFVRRNRGAAAGRLLADALATRIRTEGLAVRRAVRLGDPCTLGDRFVARSNTEVAGLFGAEVAQTVMTVPAGGWSPPVASPYGWHLVWVEARTADHPRALAAVRAQVRHGWRVARVPDVTRAGIRALRERYSIAIEPAAAARLEPAAGAGA